MKSIMDVWNIAEFEDDILLVFTMSHIQKYNIFYNVTSIENCCTFESADRSVDIYNDSHRNPKSCTYIWTGYIP
jgi:hypothetical protein